ncbi:MerR family transcriptional regulator [Falsibacillus albus]|uniref:MerR family transcriptional regulator n=1 Tax=Falsibacillus albus TaxID=2478915 RepID=A0A3L7K151_9BACI|nr:MerR family transcriptional regulator [Falsibacillus albus]RLQ96315.1 MerR family transcriptional regulator [Falsibacillus albus]
MNKNQMVRAYSIKEVSKKLNIPTGTIRQWEKDLSGLLMIPRTKQGARFYTEKEIMVLGKIKEMREQNISKDMIRSLLLKHFQHRSEHPSESLETLPAEREQQPMESPEPKPNNIKEFYNAMDQYKQDLIKEFKREMIENRKVLVDEIKNELSSTSLETVKSISKSVHRSNDKRKADLQQINDTISHISEHTSETFAALSDVVANSSKSTYEKLSKRMTEFTKGSAKDNQTTISKVSKSLKETKNDIKKVSQAFDAHQVHLLGSMNELKQSISEIQKREDAFQDMLVSYRQAAAAKSKKRWWKVFS